MRTQIQTGSSTPLLATATAAHPVAEGETALPIAEVTFVDDLQRGLMKEYDEIEKVLGLLKQYGLESSYLADDMFRAHVIESIRAGIPQQGEEEAKRTGGRGEGDTHEWLGEFLRALENVQQYRLGQKQTGAPATQAEASTEQAGLVSADSSKPKKPVVTQRRFLATAALAVGSLGISQAIEDPERFNGYALQVIAFALVGMVLYPAYIRQAKYVDSRKNTLKIEGVFALSQAALAELQRASRDFQSGAKITPEQKEIISQAFLRQRLEGANENPFITIALLCSGMISLGFVSLSKGDESQTLNIGFGFLCLVLAILYRVSCQLNVNQVVGDAVDAQVDRGLLTEDTGAYIRSITGELQQALKRGVEDKLTPGKFAPQFGILGSFFGAGMYLWQIKSEEWGLSPEETTAFSGAIFAGSAFLCLGILVPDSRPDIDKYMKKLNLIHRPDNPAINWTMAGDQPSRNDSLFVAFCAYVVSGLAVSTSVVPHQVLSSNLCALSLVLAAMYVSRRPNHEGYATFATDLPFKLDELDSGTRTGFFKAATRHFCGGAQEPDAGTEHLQLNVV